MKRRLVLVVLGVVVGIAALALILHTPFVRARVLRYALTRVQEQYAVRLEATRLDYNLAALRVGLADLRASALAPGSDPFFEADYVSVTLPGRALLGDVSFEDITVTNGRVLVVRRRDGTTNLPESFQTPKGDPPPLRIARLAVPRLAVEVRDEQNDVGVRIPAVAIQLTPNDGRVALGAPAEVRLGDRTSRISQLEGDATFDGRALHLTGAQVRTDEASIQADGSLLLIARDPAVDLTVKGTGDLARLARWGMPDGELPQGSLAFDGRVTGAMSDPRAELRVASERATWQQLNVTDVSGEARVSAAGADVPRLEFGFENGRVTASGMVPFESDGSGSLAASWTGVDAGGLVRALAPASTLLPSATIAGQFNAEGPLSDLNRWSGSARMRAEPRGNARGRVSMVGDARLEIAEGSWRLDGSQVIGGVAPVTAALRGRVENSMVAGTVRLNATDLPKLLDALRITDLATVPADTITSGTLDADIELTGTIADPVMQARAHMRGLAGAQFDAEAIDAEATGRPLEPRLQFTLTSKRALVSGQEVNDVRATGSLIDIVITVDELRGSQPSSPGLISGTGRYDLRSGEYLASIEGTQWQLVPTAEQPLAGRVNLRFTGTGTAAAPRGTGQLAVRGAMWQGQALGDLDAVARLDGRVATIQARAPEFQTTADARVALDAPYVATVDVLAQQVDLARVLQGVETPTPVTGTVTLAAHGEGPLASWRSASAAIDVASLDAKAGDLPIRLLQPGRFRYAGDRVYVDLLEASAGDTHISASGELPAFDATLGGPGMLLTVTGDVDAVARAVAATGITQVPITGGEGPVALLARVTGSIEMPIVAADFEAGPGSVTLQDLPSISGLHVRAHVEDGLIELREAVASYQGANLSATGKAPLSLKGAMELHARATNVTPAVAATFVDAATLEQVTGSVDATLDVTSPTLDLADLAGELRLDRLEMRIADLPVTQRLPTRIVARDGFARIEAWDWVGQGTTLGVRGQVRLSDRQAAILANGELDLRMLTPFVRAAGITTAGRMQPRLSITGVLDNPRIDGDVLITDGEARLVDPRVLVSDVVARAVLTGNGARIVSLTGTVNGGPLTGGGSAEIGAGGRIDTQLSANVRGMALEFPQGLRSEINAALELVMGVGADLEVGPSGRLSGTVTVVRGAYREPLAVVTGLLTTLRTRRFAASADASPVLESLALDVRLFTDEDIIVDNNYGRFQLGADLQVIGTAAAPALSGRAELREGGQLFVGRNVYTITSGTIDFANPVTIEPDLNVQATTRAGGTDIEVIITGTPEAPGVELRSTSDPDLGQAEVASLLLTGRRLEDLAPGDAAFVGTQVLGNFSAEVLGFASRAIGLDSLRLGGVDNPALRRDPTAVATELDPTTRLTFGKSLGANVDITFSQSLRDSDAQTWIVEYLPARRLELRLVSNDDDLRSYGFRHDLTFGGAAPRAVASGNESQRTQAVRVVSVSIMGELVIPEQRLRSLLRLEPGNRFDFVEWQADRDRLEQFYQREGYLTARVTASRSDVEGGVTLTYQVTPGPQTRITVTGLDLDSTLRSRLEIAWAQSVFDEFLIDEATTIVRETLAREGYLQPKIAAEVQTEGNVKTLNITVEPGARSAGISVRIDEADEALRRQIDTWLGTGGLVDQAVTDPAALERGVTAYLRSNGYLRVRVTAGAPLFEGTSAVIPLTVEAGQIVTIASITFEGAEGVTIEMLHETVGLQEGMPYDLVAADAARDRLIALYRREGFPSPAVTARQTIRTDTPFVDLTFAINAGMRQVLGEIVVTGNRAIDTDVIVRALVLTLNAPLRDQESLQARRRVFDTGLFRRVDISAEPIGPGADGRVTSMRMRVTVEEWPALRLRYGFQVAEERPAGEIEGRNLVPGLSADLTRRTLFGRAITTGGAVVWQRRERMGRLFASAPTLLGWPIESSVTLDRSREEFAGATLLTDASGISWEERARVAGNLTLSFAYRFERNHTFDTKIPLDANEIFFDIAVNIARITGSAAWDTRDDPAGTTRGSLFSSSLEYAPEGAGSDIRFIRQVSQAYYFRQWRGAVLASAARLGMVRPIAGQELIPSERFFAGGPGTVRGVGLDSLGERDFFGDPAGGQAMAVFNQELRVPLYRWVRGVGFVDAGNVFPKAGDLRFRDLVGSVGVGLRLATPFALLRVDFAKPVWAGPTVRSGRWSFGIGHAF